MAVAALTIASAFLPPRLSGCPRIQRKGFGFRCKSSLSNEEEYLVDAPVSIGDGFSFSGGKYAKGPSQIDEWFARGKMVNAHPANSSKGKAKDPIFGLTMGGGSQTTDDVFRWFCVEAGDCSNPSIILIHGFPSQAYSFRKALPVLAEEYHVIAFDWIGFGFSDKPQPRYGFDYTLDEYVSSLESLIDEFKADNLSLVVQGYFSPVVVKYASYYQEKIRNLILINPPLTEEHAKLPPSLSIFSTFLLGEIFSQDPLRASDKVLTSSGPYMMLEEDAMVYRRPYLTSGSSGFALNAISKSMKKDLKRYVEYMRTALASSSWKINSVVCWGLRDRWLSYNGIEDFCKSSNLKLVQLPKAGHHDAQEDSGEELGTIVADIIGKGM
ncbi:uncharacterized hydrolase YNR064C isoform X1 [Phalaenopsis equestris]|uniref:uncharacterized hydrolase YNR064C isoform X1 n=1 Tax=Phalaenopsis equestris TaxID=78828 RepID=UPI0009E49436|nr:uncharacterized hydrolase YNR064C isoform X1 [Phalaenopsis equestris]